MGESALRDQVDRHYFSAFLAAGAIGVLSGFSIQRGNPLAGGLDGTLSSAGSGLAGTGDDILDRFLNRLPTVTIRRRAPPPRLVHLRRAHPSPARLILIRSFTMRRFHPRSIALAALIAAGTASFATDRDGTVCRLRSKQPRPADRGVRPAGPRIC